MHHPVTHYVCVYGVPFYYKIYMYGGMVALSGFITTTKNVTTKLKCYFELMSPPLCVAMYSVVL